MASRSLGVLSIDLVAKTAGFSAGMDKAARDAKTKLTQIEKTALGAGKAIGTGIRFAAVGIAAATTALTALTVQSINYADELQDLSGKLGISTEQLSKWAYVANLSGTDIETVARSVNLLGKNLAAAADPTSKMGETFAALGISVKDAAGNLRSAEDVLPEIADRFKALDNQTTETALALQLFGKSGAEMLEFLNRGAGGIKDLEDELASLGGVISTDTARAAEQFKDELSKLQIVGRGLGLQIAQELLPTLIDTAQEFRQLVKDGDLAANIVGVISAAMTAGVKAIGYYNTAVQIATESLVAFVRLSVASATITQNVATFGYADGTVASSIKEQADAVRDLVAAREKLVAQRDAGGAGPTVTMIDPGEGLEAWKQQQALAKDSAGLQVRLNKLMEDSSGAAARSAAKAAKEAEREAEKIEKALNKMSEAQRKWTTELEGTGNPILDEYARRLDEVKSSAEDFSRLNVAQEKVAAFTAEMQKLALAIKDKELADYRREFNWDTQQISDSLTQASGSALSYERALFALNKELKTGLITQEQYDDRLSKEQEKRHEAATSLLRDIQFEIELTKMGNVERQTAIQLRGMDTESVEKYGKAIADANQEIYDQMQRIDLMDGFRDSFKNFFTDVISGTESVTDAFKNMLDDINARILDRITTNWVDQLFGAMGTAQGGAAGGNWFQMLAGIFGGGRANGGWAAANTMYEVNERGLEMATVGGRDFMLTGNQPVQVTPNHKLGGGVSQVNQFTIQGRIDRRTEDQIAEKVGWKTQVAMARNG